MVEGMTSSFKVIDNFQSATGDALLVLPVVIFDFFRAARSF
jgi:hypothetical protein